MKPIKATLAAALGAAALLVWYWQDEQAEQQRLAAQQAAEAAQRAADAGKNTGLRDLFATPAPASSASGTQSGDAWQALNAAAAQHSGEPGEAAEPKLEPETAEQLALNDSLRRLGYHIDERYYRMPLAELRRTAASNDRQALTHLAERYLFALDGKPTEPEFEPGFAYRDAARQALQQAYLAGNLHAAAMISEAYLIERRPTDAAAWNLIAQRVGDKLSADWFLTTRDYQQLSDEQKQLAARQADTIWAQLEARKRSNG
ncbi:hypothetical protein RQP53_10910 [Paucibacter sp. APW11]|uniref:Sel1 repeat family protein n=1 Tax=Roseateles aquae TaxID=3077235 RepID=A0ABU3PB76_9BURK|nr:hypothetical protein [Paucibacter sp. APW11]MDT8999778.1 hypothetical protein [Paucibacter sp. APW11]